MLKYVNPLDPEQEKQAIREALDAMGLKGYELDPKAHMTLEVLQSLRDAVIVGAPRTWMTNNFENTNPLPNEAIHPQLLAILRKINDISEGQAEEHIARITELANTKDPKFAEPSDNPELRKEYQDHEWDLMNLVVSAIEEDIVQIPSEQTLLWIVLRGAKFHQAAFEEFASCLVENESKRLKLKDGIFAMAHRFSSMAGDLGNRNIRQVIIPDDCLSTGMSQAENIKMIFELGFRPERIVVPVTVATTDGFAHLKNLERELKIRFGGELVDDFCILIATAATCESVNEEMYLQTLDGRALVGDMGNWNRAVGGDTGFDSEKDSAEQ